jgi:hypothetical protein
MGTDKHQLWVLKLVDRQTISVTERIMTPDRMHDDEK